MNNLTKDLKKVYASRGIVLRDESIINDTLDAVIKALPDHNIESEHDPIHSMTFKTGALAYKALLILELNAAKRSE